MKRNILILSLLTCMSTAFFAAAEVNPSKSTQSNRKKNGRKKRTCSATPLSCATTIKHSGPYCLTKDIVGTIVIAANNVSLDLNSHEVNAAGEPIGILIENATNVKVFNGSVSHASQAGILVDPSFGIELSHLVMHDNPLVSIEGLDSHNLHIHDVDFQGSNGETALSFDTCKTITVERCYASGFLSTSGAIIELNGCDCVSIKDVDVCDNTKSLALPTGSFVSASRLISADDCTGVDFVKVKVNNNTIQSNVDTLKRFTAIGFNSSHSCSLHQCEASNNTDVVGSGASENTLDRMLFIANSSHFIVTEFQANNNRCEQPITAFIGISTINASNLVFDGCQTNSNSIAAFTVAEGFTSDLNGVEMVDASIPGVPTQDCVIRNHQTNYNRCDNGGDRLPTSPAARVTGITMQHGTGDGILLDHCQANHNALVTNGIREFVSGINIIGTNNVTISNSTADNNSGGSFAEGIHFALNVFAATTNTINTTIDTCSASNNDGVGLLLSCPSHNINIVDSVFNQNGRNDGGGTAGIATANPIYNLFIKGCQVYGTFGGGAGTANGIEISESFNVVIEDTDVFNSNNVIDFTEILDVASITGDGPFFVTFTIVPQTVPPLVGINYQVFGDGLNPGYEGTFVATASTLTTLTLSYPTNPGEYVPAGFLAYSFIPTGPGNGIVLNNVFNAKIIRSELLLNKDAGVLLDGNNAGITVLDCIAQGNDTGFLVTGESLGSGLFQGNIAHTNVSAGFVHTPAILATSFIGNKAQFNGENGDRDYDITGGVINLQELKLSDGSVSQVPLMGSGAVLGSTIANLRTVV